MVSKPKRAVILGSVMFPIFLMLPMLFGGPPVLGTQGESCGVASWYSWGDPGIGSQTASGEVFDDTQATCAAWNYPFGTPLKITNVRNGRSVVCRVNDRGPAPRLGRAVDLTKSSFEKIADPEKGLIQVKIVPLSLGADLSGFIQSSA